MEKAARSGLLHALAVDFAGAPGASWGRVRRAANPEPELRVLEGGRRRRPSDAVLLARAVVLGLVLASLACLLVVALVLGLALAVLRLF
jgi:hypothetical protein